MEPQGNIKGVKLYNLERRDRERERERERVKKETRRRKLMHTL